MDDAEKVLERVDSMHLEFAKRAAVSHDFRELFWELFSAVLDLFWKHCLGNLQCFLVELNLQS
jgi:hypothetical protein